MTAPTAPRCTGWRCATLGDAGQVTARTCSIVSLALLGTAAACSFVRPRPSPASVELSTSPGLARGLAIADSLITAALGARIPGAVLVVAKDGAVIHERAFGHAEL